LQKKEEKLVRQLRCKITFHEARGGNRPGKVGDKRGHWSPNPEWDKVNEIKAQIKEIEVNAQKRAWGEEGALKDLGREQVTKKIVEGKMKAAKEAEEAAKVAGSPTSQPAKGSFVPAIDAI
jgi:hypothetical protein